MVLCKLIFCILCYMFLFLDRQTPSLTVEKLRTTHQLFYRAGGSGFCLPMIFVLGPALSSISPNQLELFVLALHSALPLILSGFDSSKMLLLMFNGRIFYLLSDVIAYIHDYREREECVALYVDVVKQVEKILNLKSAFAKGLIKIIKKNKS